MKQIPSCILYSSDSQLIDRLVRISSQTIAMQPVQTQRDLEQRYSQFGDAILLADLRAPNCLDVLSSVKKGYPLSVIITIGAERSDPMLAAELLEPYASIPLEIHHNDFSSLMGQAIECFTLRLRNSILAQELNTLSARATSNTQTAHVQLSTPLQHFAKAHRNVDNLDTLFESIVEGLAATARVSRAGIFTSKEPQSAYSYKAGTRCLPATQQLSVQANDPFIRWMELNPHLVSRATLQNILDPEERAMLKGMLAALGAEIIIPLYSTESLMGWVFVGQRSSGIPFDIEELDELTTLADHISTTLDTAIQYGDTALQKALAETLLHSIPFGIIACDDNAVVRWFNSTANHILRPDNDDPIGCRVETLGSQIADMFHRTIESQAIQDAKEWTEARTKRTLSAETRCLHADGKCIGAMMMLRDVTGAKLLQEKTEQLERAAFWNELASSMSHEIRNPLVAIKTFSQLLPDRYEDAEFRADFSEQVTAEVDQLNRIIDKINEFANPPTPVYQPMDIHKPIEFAVTRVQSEFDHDNLKIHLSSDESSLAINGDSPSLEECFYHLFKNAAENLDNRPGSRINVIVKGRPSINGQSVVYVMITDNGTGIDPSLRDKVYSPFSTMKARGLGLGLPIAKRTIIDHNGQIDIETSDAGTTISISIPVINTEAK